MILKKGQRLPHNLPNKVISVVALWNLDFTYEEIMEATQLKKEVIREIVRNKSPDVVRLLNEGFPPGTHGNLRKAIKCPTCASKILKVPCVTCTIREVKREG